MKYRIKSDLRKGGIVFDIQQVLEEIHDDVPPGILSFKRPFGTIASLNQHFASEYERWVTENLNHHKSTIHSIKVGDEVWEVGNTMRFIEAFQTYERVITKLWWSKTYQRWEASAKDFDGIPLDFAKKVEQKVVYPDLYPMTIEGRLERIEKWLNIKK